jgi:hypothetical protein
VALYEHIVERPETNRKDAERCEPPSLEVNRQRSYANPQN